MKRLIAIILLVAVLSSFVLAVSSSVDTSFYTKSNGSSINPDIKEKSLSEIILYWLITAAIIFLIIFIIRRLLSNISAKKNKSKKQIKTRKTRRKK